MKYVLISLLFLTACTSPLPETRSYDNLQVEVIYDNQVIDNCRTLAGRYVVIAEDCDVNSRYVGGSLIETTKDNYQYIVN